MANAVNKPARAFCFTLNNPTTNELDFSTLAFVRYASWQREACPTTGTEHLQGYMEFSRPVRMSAFKQSILDGAHFEHRLGTRDQARDYTRKPDTRIDGPFEYGEWTSGGQGARQDLKTVTEMVKRGASMAEIADSDAPTLVKHHRGLQYLAGLYRRGRTGDDPVRVVFIHGTPGCGKSRRATELFPGAYRKPPGQWWDYYEGERTVILDDFTGSSLSYTQWKLVCDRYPHYVEAKGTTIPLAATTVVITSCKLPLEWWNSEKVPVLSGEIYRRITEVHGYDTTSQEFFIITQDDCSPGLHPIDLYLSRLLNVNE